MDPFPGVRMMTFFAKTVKPFGVTIGMNRKDSTAVFQAEAATFAAHFKKEVQKVTGAGDMQQKASVKNEVKRAQDEKKKATSVAAREKAMQAVAKKLSRRKVTIG